MSRTRPPNPRGVTLLELLFVLVILAVLAGLLAGAIGGILGAVNTARCRSQLRQIGAAYTRYISDSQGAWPPILTTDPKDVPWNLFERIEADTGLRAAPPRPAANYGRPGPHWSIVLYPYLGDLALCTCPADPRAGLRGEAVLAAGGEHGIALLDAPPESYALNVILFRTQDDLRRQAGCTWGTHGDADYSGLGNWTTLAEQRRRFPGLARRIHFFCGASGQTVGSQYNMPLRTSGLSGTERWAWHPRRASRPFADEPGCGSNYLFGDGAVEYRDTLPNPWEWGYELDRRPGGP